MTEAEKTSQSYFADMISFICKHYGWTPDYVLKKLTFQQAFIYYDKAIEHIMIENGQKPKPRLRKSEIEAESNRIKSEVEEMKQKIKDKQNA